MMATDFERPDTPKSILPWLAELADLSGVLADALQDEGATNRGHRGLYIIAAHVEAECRKLRKDVDAMTQEDHE